MKFTPADENRRYHELELTRRNLTALLAKLDDPDSQRTLIDPDGHALVIAVEDAEHYASRPPGVTFTQGVHDDSWPGKKEESNE